jgi:large subunit ribosomal protein L9
LFASKENIKEVEKIKIELSKKDQEKKKEAKNIQEKIQNKEYEIKKLSTENEELYGSVKPTEISKILSEREKIEINPSMIQPVKEIKSIGIFEVILNLHSQIQSQISIKVVPEENSK